MTNIALILATALLLLPCLVLLAECLAAALPARRTRSAIRSAAQPRTAILIPAHNEEAGIDATVTALLSELANGDRLIVIADNCTDATAAVARSAGATVVERCDAERRGKGFAIAFGLRLLDAAPPDVVVLVDADCRLSPAGGVAALARLCREHDRPVQAEYVPAAPAGATPLGVVGGLAVLVRNRVRPRGLSRLGLPCQLTGSGMAFPWRVLRQAPDTGSNLVEDLVMGLDMALAGHAPLAYPEVQVSSKLPEGNRAAIGQRRRWEHGQIGTLVNYGPRLLIAGILRARADLLGLALDLMVPPLALLVMMVGAMTALAAGTAILGWSSWTAAGLGVTALAAVTAGVGAAWFKFGRQALPFRFLLVVPFYVAWKIPLYVALLVARKQRTWDRTARGVETAGSSTPTVSSAGARLVRPAPASARVAGPDIVHDSVSPAVAISGPS